MTSSPAPSSVSPGQKFGKYVIKRLMAEGGMATVYEAVHGKLGHRVAIKLLSRHLMSKPDVVERFEREARAAARLESSNVVKVIDVDTAEDGRPYIVMEYLEGRDLETEIRSRGGQLPIGDAVAYVLEAAAAVAVAHRAGVIHRDLKPANIFLAQEGSRRVVKVLDFGISKVSSANEVSSTSTQTMLGTPLYMSPEQVRSARDVDGRADIWSLGVVLYEAISGQLPFLSEDASGVIAAIVSDPVVPISQLRPDIPPPLAAAIMKTLEKDRNARFRLVEELAAALIPFAPAWFRPPKMVTQPPFMPAGLPPHLAHSLSDGIDSERTVADPNHAPDAHRSDVSVGAPGVFALGPTTQAPSLVQQTPDPSQPSAVTRTTAGGGKRPLAMNQLGIVVLTVAAGVIVGALVITAILVLHNRTDRTEAAPPAPTNTTQPTAPSVTVPVIASATTAAVTATASASVTATVTATASVPASTDSVPSATSAPSAPAHTRPHGVGKLDVNMSSGWCAVAVDGTSAGDTPVANYAVTAGPHVVSCTTSGGVIKRQSIDIAPNETTRVKF